MNTYVTFTVYGTTLEEIRGEAIAELARFSGSDFRWSINIDCTASVMTRNGTVLHYKGEVSARPKQNTPDWQDGS